MWIFSDFDIHATDSIEARRPDLIIKKKQILNVADPAEWKWKKTKISLKK